MKIGFSTGSIALDDVRRGLDVATHRRAKAIELSALREEELDPLLSSLSDLHSRLESFEHIAFHAPSRRNKLSEAELVSKLQQVADRDWAIIVHPDMISDFSLWLIELTNRFRSFLRRQLRKATLMKKFPPQRECSLRFGPLGSRPFPDYFEFPALEIGLLQENKRNTRNFEFFEAIYQLVWQKIWSPHSMIS